MSKSKIKSKYLNFFGMKVDYKEYTQKFLPEATYQLEKIYNKLGMKTEIKTTIKTKSKYWDLNKKYPTTLDNFISKNFKKKKTKRFRGYMGTRFYGKSNLLWIFKREGNIPCILYRY